jgi:cytochrome c oxidase subunit 4
MTEPIVSPRTYALTFASLLALTLLTTLLAFLDLGRLNVVLEIGIAILKASLIVLIFMHALHEFKLVWVVIAAGIGWFLLPLSLTLYDYVTRAWI